MDPLFIKHKTTNVLFQCQIISTYACPISILYDFNPLRKACTVSSSLSQRSRLALVAVSSPDKIPTRL